MSCPLSGRCRLCGVGRCGGERFCRPREDTGDEAAITDVLNSANRFPLTKVSESVSADEGQRIGFSTIGMPSIGTGMPA
jgi:hypothetical protein